MITLLVWLAILGGVALGMMRPRFCWQGLWSVALLAALFWLGRCAVILLIPADAAVGDYYLDALDLRRGLIEYGVSLLWMLACYGLGRMMGRAGRGLRRRRAG